MDPGAILHIPMKEAYCSKASLKLILRDYKAPFAGLFTGIPKDANYDNRDWVGKTFGASFLPKGIWTLDPHGHPRAASGPRGMVLAHEIAKPSQPYHELLDSFG